MMPAFFRTGLPHVPRARVHGARLTYGHQKVVNQPLMVAAHPPMEAPTARFS